MGETIGIMVKASWRLMKDYERFLSVYGAQIDSVQFQGGRQLSRTASLGVGGEPPVNCLFRI